MGNLLTFIGSVRRQFSYASPSETCLGIDRTPKSTPEIKPIPQNGLQNDLCDIDELYELNLTDEEAELDEWIPFSNSYRNIVSLVDHFKKNTATTPDRQMTEYEIR